MTPTRTRQPIASPPAVRRRGLLSLFIAGICLLTGRTSQAVQPDNLAWSLVQVLPPGLHPIAVGRRLLASQPGPLTREACIARSGIDASPVVVAVLRERVSSDFAAGRIEKVDGWRLASTEAWLCAAAACDA